MADQLRVLVVEDDRDTAQFVQTVLARRGGMDVTVAHDPAAALELAAGTQFDAVVTDIQMPGMSGLELLGELRRRSAGMPVAVMTAFASVDYAVEALRRDADEFLVKPVSAATLLEKIGALAAEGRRRREASAAEGEVVLAVGAHPDAKSRQRAQGAPLERSNGNQHDTIGCPGLDARATKRAANRFQELTGDRHDRS